MRGMNYEEWIGRERRIRSTLLMSSAEINNKGICRICKDCSEICLCHETNCPNCGGSQIVAQQVNDVEREVQSGNRIRCRFRFGKMNQIEKQEKRRKI